MTRTTASEVWHQTLLAPTTHLQTYGVQVPEPEHRRSVR